MALTKEYEYDCEVRGPYKAVQVRKATIVKDDDERLAVITTGTFSIAAPNLATHGVTPTSLARMPAYRQCATPCGLAQSSLPTRPLQTHKQLSNGEQPWH